MKIKRTKYKRVTPKTQVEYSTWNIALNFSIVSLLEKVIQSAIRFFGNLYMNMSLACLYIGNDLY